MVSWVTEGVPSDPSMLASWEGVDEFFSAQANSWNAVEDGGLSRGAALVVQRARSALNTARRLAQNQRNNGYGPQNVPQVVQSAFVDNGDLGTAAMSASVLSDRRFRIIAEGASLSSALFHVGLKRGLVSMADARDREDIIGALWDVAPGLQATSDLAGALQKERENSRQSVRRLIDEAERKDRARIDEWEGKLQEAYAAYVGWARRRSTRWGNHTRKWEQRHREAERRINAVHETYTERMGLKAPVDYWNNKAVQHRKSETLTMWLVVAFFVITLPSMALVFNETGKSLINQAAEIRPQGAPPFPTAIFLIASAGLASCAGLVFWAGRLITKLYLSQHHLRQDAEERATMTKAYLAMIENSAASPEDRQVILNALFRNTPDGIVKEEGGLDPSIAAALGKFLAK